MHWMDFVGISVLSSALIVNTHQRGKISSPCQQPFPSQRITRIFAFESKAILVFPILLE